MGRLIDGSESLVQLGCIASGGGVLSFVEDIADTVQYAITKTVTNGVVAVSTSGVPDVVISLTPIVGYTGALSGQYATSDALGFAYFPSLSFDTAYVGMRLTANAYGFTQASSNFFDIGVAPNPFLTPGSLVTPEFALIPLTSWGGNSESLPQG